MIKSKDDSTPPGGEDQRRKLRDQAEEKIVGEFKLLKQKTLTPEITQTLVHDLQVHQVELEIQNEELRRIQDKLEESRANYFDLYDMAPVGYVTVGETGMILEGNLTAAGMLGTERGALVGQPFSRYIIPADQDAYYHHRRKVMDIDATRSIELGLRRADGTSLAARLDCNAFHDEWSDANVLRVTITDISEYKRTAELVTFLAEAGDQPGKLDLVAALATFLARNLDVDFVSIDRLLEDKISARSLAAWMDGRSEAGLESPLTDAAQSVMEKTICLLSDAHRQFPSDPRLQKIEAESFAGCAIRDPEGKPIGMILVGARKTFPNPARVEAALKLSAAIIAGKLLRQKD